MSKPSKRSVLGVLTKKKLIELDRGSELGTMAASSKDDFVEALARSKKASFDKLLATLGKGDLQVVCEAHELAKSGTRMKSSSASSGGMRVRARLASRKRRKAGRRWPSASRPRPPSLPSKHS